MDLNIRNWQIIHPSPTPFVNQAGVEHCLSTFFLVKFNEWNSINSNKNSIYNIYLYTERDIIIDLENRVLSNAALKPSTYCRYVDDIHVVIVVMLTIFMWLLPLCWRYSCGYCCYVDDNHVVIVVMLTIFMWLLWLCWRYSCGYCRYVDDIHVVTAVMLTIFMWLLPLC